jgi:hypothetical protein
MRNDIPNQTAVFTVNENKNSKEYARRTPVIAPPTKQGICRFNICLKRLSILGMTIW